MPGCSALSNPMSQVAMSPCTSSSLLKVRVPSDFTQTNHIRTDWLCFIWQQQQNMACACWILKLITTIQASAPEQPCYDLHKSREWRWPTVSLHIVNDAGFARENMMAIAGDLGVAISSSVSKSGKEWLFNILN